MLLPFAVLQRVSHWQDNRWQQMLLLYHRVHLLGLGEYRQHTYSPDTPGRYSGGPQAPGAPASLQTSTQVGWGA